MSLLKKYNNNYKSHNATIRKTAQSSASTSSPQVSQVSSKATRATTVEGKDVDAIKLIKKQGEDAIIEINSLKYKLTEALQEIKDAKSLVYYGFIAFLLVLAGLVFSYVEFVYSGSKNDDYKYDLSERVNIQENNLEDLKKCLSISKWLNPKCLQD